MILINRCYSIVTPESAENGDFAESGMLAENIAYGFRELVDAMRDASEVSAWPASGCTSEWLCFDQGETRDFIERGEREEQTLHYSRNNPPHCAKYWRLAMIAAGHAQ